MPENIILFPNINSTFKSLIVLSLKISWQWVLAINWKKLSWINQNYSALSAIHVTFRALYTGIAGGILEHMFPAGGTAVGTSLDCRPRQQRFGSLRPSRHSPVATLAAEGPSPLQGAGQQSQRKGHSLSLHRPTKHSSPSSFSLSSADDILLQEVQTDQGTILTKLKYRSKAQRKSTFLRNVCLLEKKIESREKI